MSSVYITQTTSFLDNEIKNELFNLMSRIMNAEMREKTNTVAIKLNLCYYWNYSTGLTSDIRTVGYLIDYIREKINGNATIFIVEADASAMKTKHAFQMLGLNKLAKEKGVSLLNLSEKKDRESTEVLVKKKKIKVTYSKKIEDFDLFINLAKLKYHKAAGVTGALKNIFGTISEPKKVRYHRAKETHHAIAAINSVVKPHIHILDGIIAYGKYPKKMGVFIGGTNPVKVDTVAARIMNINPFRVKHLKYSKKFFKKEKFENVYINCSLKRLRKEFPKPKWIFHRMSWYFQLLIIRIYTKLLGDLIPPILDIK